jgi:hypothetical protein
MSFAATIIINNVGHDDLQLPGNAKSRAGTPRFSELSEQECKEAAPQKMMMRASFQVYEEGWPYSQPQEKRSHTRM